MGARGNPHSIPALTPPCTDSKLEGRELGQAAGRVRGPRQAGRGWPSEASRRAGRNTKLTPEPPPPPAQTCPPRCPQPHPTFIGVPGVTGEPRVPAAWKLPRLSGGHTPCRRDTEKGWGVAGGAPHPGAPEVTVCAETQGHYCRPQPFEHPLQSDDRVKTRPNPPPRHQGSAIDRRIRGAVRPASRGQNKGAQPGRSKTASARAAGDRNI